MSVGNHHEIAFEKISPCGRFNEVFETFCLEIQNTNVITEGFQPSQNIIEKPRVYTANVYRGLQGDQGGFLQYLHGKPYDYYRISLQSVNITGFSLQILQQKPLTIL